MNLPRGQARLVLVFSEMHMARFCAHDCQLLIVNWLLTERAKVMQEELTEERQGGYLDTAISCSKHRQCLLILTIQTLYVCSFLKCFNIFFVLKLGDIMLPRAITDNRCKLSSREDAFSGIARSIAS